VEYLTASIENFEMLKDNCANKKVFLEGLVIDLKEWQEPWVSLKLGVRPHKFLNKVLDKNLFECDPNTLGYTDLKLSVSLMKFLKYEDQKIVDIFQ
jgi:hypothetical protein